MAQRFQYKRTVYLFRSNLQLCLCHESKHSERGEGFPLTFHIVLLVSNAPSCAAQVLCPVLLSFTGDDNHDLQLYVVNCLAVVKVFLYCLCSLTWWGPDFGWGLLRSNEIQMMSRSSDLPFCYNTCEIAGPNWELWHSCLKLQQTKSEAFPFLFHLSLPSSFPPSLSIFLCWNKLLPHSTFFSVGFQTHCSLFQEEHFTWGPYSKWIYMIRQIVSTLACKANKKRCCSANYPCKCSLKG